MRCDSPSLQIRRRRSDGGDSGSETTPVEGAEPVPCVPPEPNELEEPDEPVLGAEGALLEVPELDILIGSVVRVLNSL